MKQVYPAVKAFILYKDTFLIIRQTVNKVELWDLPGGKVDYGEDPHQTLIREVKEEINLTVVIERELGMYYFFRFPDENQVAATVFLCKPTH